MAQENSYLPVGFCSEKAMVALLSKKAKRYNMRPPGKRTTKKYTTYFLITASCTEKCIETRQQ